MTAREQQVLKAIEKAGGRASSAIIGRQMGISSDYAEQLCRDLVWQGKILRKGRHFMTRMTKSRA